MPHDDHFSLKDICNGLKAELVRTSALGKGALTRREWFYDAYFFNGISTPCGYLQTKFDSFLNNCNYEYMFNVSSHFY